MELDGAQHGMTPGQRRDAVRDDYLRGAGYRILRFWNNEITDNLDGVVETILAALPADSKAVPN